MIESDCLLKQEMHVLLPGGEGTLPELLAAAALVGQDTHLLQVIPRERDYSALASQQV